MERDSIGSKEQKDLDVREHVSHETSWQIQQVVKKANVILAIIDVYK